MQKMNDLSQLFLNKYLDSIMLIILVATTVINFVSSDDKKEFNFYPSDWFHDQRAFPFDDIPVEKYFEAINKKSEMSNLGSNKFDRAWYPIGPFNIGGRITALDVDDANGIIYAAAAAGGVFKSTDNGITWQAKTDFFPSLSVGALKIDKASPNIIYCGTGEANISTDSYAGFGMLKSTDFGETWFLSGLENSRHIAEIEIHPMNSSLIYAAVSGGLYSKSEDRGVYKSTDAGTTWEKVLFINDSTSAIDVAVDPQDVNRVYAAVWERLRGPSFRKAAGISSGLYMTTDGGNNWTQMTSGLPQPNPVIGRISIAVAPSNPDIIYALYKSAEAPNGTNNYFSGFYKSINKGINWTQMPDDILPMESASFGWYFGLLEVDPFNHNKVYVGDVDLLRSTNGGTSWTNITNSYSGTFDEQHPDMHSLWINPDNTDHLINGNDGGAFSTLNGGNTWAKMYDLPVSQFYASTIDYLNPQRKYGGTQDNGSMRTIDGGLDNWEMIYGGDGFHTQVDYTNSNIIYCESQNGGIGRSTNGGTSFEYIDNELDLSRTNWSSPYMIDIKNPATLYFGSYKLHRTTNRGDNWTEISGDLTRGSNGRLGTITAISSAVASDTTKRIIYVATDDAKISVSTNTGTTWTDVTGTLHRRYMTDVLADKRNPSTAYLTLSGYNLDETNPHVFRTTNLGSTWNDISGNLPDVPVNSIIIDYDHDSVLYIGTDIGVFYTINLGTSWNVLGTGLPNSPVFDINYHQPTKKIVAATHGRSMFEIDISNITSVDNNKNIPNGFILKQNYPNPFNPGTKISWQTSAGSWQTLKVYDILGNEIAILVNEYRPAGSYEVEFNIQNHSSKSGINNLASGIYLYKLKAGDFEQTKKMILMK